LAGIDRVVKLPSLPIPSFLCGAEAGSFAEDTILRRLPELARRVLVENELDETARGCMHALISDLPHGTIRPLLDAHAPDWHDWEMALQSFIGLSWLEVPLFVAETYFYRRILEATGYFQTGTGAVVDPYHRQKDLGLAQAGQELAQFYSGNDGDLHRLLLLSLWGNQADLSLWPIQGKGGGRAEGGGSEEHLLVDASEDVLEYFQGLKGGRVDFLLDNCGIELIIDLLLVDALLAQNQRITIRLQVKPHPIFVSDAMEADVVRARRWLKTNAPKWAETVAARLDGAEAAGRLQVETHFYWASPSPAWEMPDNLQADLAESMLIISKGDVNYRRWLGDARWPPTTSLDKIINPPAPLLLLRVTKSDVIAGLYPGQVEEIQMLDPSWQVNGHWGLVQFLKPQK
jgi:hypothetical protein